MILSPSIFEGEISIGQQFSPSVDRNVEWFINEYEPKYCSAVIGEKLYGELIDGLHIDDENSEIQIEERWLTLKEKLTSTCARYVYFHYMKNMVTGTMGSGEYATMAENSERKSPWLKMVSAWNKMVDETPGIRKWIDKKSDVYPDYLPNLKLYVELGISRYENMWGV